LRSRERRQRRGCRLRRARRTTAAPLESECSSRGRKASEALSMKRVLIEARAVDEEGEAPYSNSPRSAENTPNTARRRASGDVL
jgi:hypothetical protein